jgi:hypothetical protein
MSVYNEAAAFTKGVLGSLTRKPTQAVVTNSTNTLFTVTGGLVMVTALVGRVTTAIPNTASLTAKIVYTPSGGSAADLSAATAITDDAIGTFYTLPATALPADLVSEITAAGSEAPNINFATISPIRLILGAGVIGLTVSNHTSTPGAVSWYCGWVPLDDGAAVA